MRSIRILLVLLFAMVSACYAGSVPLHVCDGEEAECNALSPESEEAVVEAEEILQMPITIHKRTTGTIITLFVGIEGDKYIGRNISLSPTSRDPARPCLELIYAARDGHVLAHEIGHALGLKHPCETNSGCPNKNEKANTCRDGEYNDRLMFPIVGGTKLTDKERETMERNLRRLQTCP